MVYIDEVEVDQEGIAEIMLDESAIAQVAREYLRKKLPSFLFINDINSTMPTFLGCSMIELIKLLFIVFYIAGLFFFCRTWNIAEAPWNKSWWRTYSSYQVHKY